MRRALAAAALAALVACTSSPADRHVTPSPSADATNSAVRKMRELCVRPPLEEEPATPSKNVPDVIATTEQQVEAVRQLQYEEPVAVDAINHPQLVEGIDQQFAHSYPKDLVHRRSIAWQTIGTIPDGTELADVYHDYYSSQVIGYYDPLSKQLVYIGSDDPSPEERFVLAHELTHALDDQHFHLLRINGLENRCEDERLQAASGAIEGSAVYFSVQVVQRFFSETEKQGFGGGGSVPTGIPQFVINMQQWPYTDGPEFIASLVGRGGTDLVNDALQHLPASTEQVIHPERYPDDVPTPVDVPQLAKLLGSKWHDLDVEPVGEEWLLSWLGLRLDATEWRPAADGWDGGIYRAWTDDEHVAVVMETAWDSEHDAQEFQQAVKDWAGEGDAISPVLSGDRVTVLIASDRPTLARLKSATSK